MTIVYLVAFIGGLLLAVRVMIAGVERERAEHPSGERTFRLSPPVMSIVAILFGIVGYILTRRQLGTASTRLGSAIVLAVVAGWITARLVRQWWTVTPEHEVDDERYILQGHLARVTKPINAGVGGEVAFEIGAERRVLSARTIDSSSLAAGSDVVIERIEDDIAYVESWAEVEKRL